MFAVMMLLCSGTELVSIGGKDATEIAAQDDAGADSQLVGAVDKNSTDTADEKDAATEPQDEDDDDTKRRLSDY